MTQRIQLPPQLPGQLDLKALNRQLMYGSIELDWSKVRTASEYDLRTLLARLDLAEHAEALGLATVSDQMAEQIIRVLDQDVEQETAPVTESQPEELSSEGEKRKQTARRVPEPMEPVLQPPSPAVLRAELEQLVLQDLLGPAGGPTEEIVEGSVRDRYLVGLLAPSYEQLKPEELDSLALSDAGGSEDGPVDEMPLNTLSFRTSSLGLSFCVDGAATHLTVTASWGRYHRVRSETAVTKTGAPALVWKRQPMGEHPLIIDLQEGTLKPQIPEPEEQPDVRLQGKIRRTGQDWTVTLFLVNGQREPKLNRDTAWIFQPELSVSGAGPIFRPRQLPRRQQMSDEERTTAMLYRQTVSFAIGHGISTQAETLPHDPTRALRITTCVAPGYEVPRTEPPTLDEQPDLAGLVLDMRELAQIPAARLATSLAPLVTAYGNWIDQQYLQLASDEQLLATYRDVAQQSLQACQRTRERIQQGIDLLASNPQAARAFAFMNEAMWQQRIHTLFAEGGRRGQSGTLDDYDQPHNRSWRPFQLAFILLNLPALTDLHHPERSLEPGAVADLLWFPTGGGKTEAYLGLTAYTLAIRRLQGVVAGRSGEDGIAVIMRYTLRLLTLQQFQRASTLMCACEMIRRRDPQGSWGQTPFRLGLWVGMRSTPNTTLQSEEASKQERGAGSGYRGSAIGGIGSPHQLTNCPWCGTGIEPGRDIRVERFASERGRTLIFCGDTIGQCPFSDRQAPNEGLPVLVVDEEIYRCLPALLIATVDKFAQMPWNGATQMLFGQVEKKCSRHGFRSPDLEDADYHRASRGWPAAHSEPQAPLRPPDLIIQDELHLISGPLGTLVGLYENVVDRLSTWEVNGQAVRPKVIAATATIRRASQQVKALFMRDVEVFPPNGLDVTDTFFARQRQPSAVTPGRRYLGICAPGRRLKATLIRVYVAFLSASQYLYLRYGQAADPWMTLVGYFNSMNELGGMRRLVEDDVRSRLSKMKQRGMAQRNAPYLEELTSRKSSTDIPRVLDLLERTFQPAPHEDDESVRPPRPLDVLLATNMISVGVDVKRLGLMVVTGQPKTTAEYIQATSRVGRTYPGLVCVVYNWSRPRDLSHYEQFAHYHATFYQQVEALSVTPFAARALDRGLAALLVSYVRLLGSEYNENSQAGRVSANSLYFTLAIDDLSRRAYQITGDAQLAAQIREALAELKDDWVDKIATTGGGAVLGYKTQRDGKTIGLLRPPGQRDWEPFTCLNSLRDVEPSINLILDTRSLGTPREQSVSLTPTAEEPRS